MGTQSQQVLFHTYCWNSRKYPPTTAVGKRENIFDFFFFFKAAGGAICFFSLRIVNKLINISSCDDRRSIST